MDIRLDILWIILGTSLVTLLPRVIPLVVLSRFELPPGVLRFLNQVPIAVMSALLAQEIFLESGRVVPLMENIKLLAALPTFLVAMLTKSLLGTVVTGVVTMALLQLWL
ncbi:AzlD domain-containing protein [Paenibacillus caseinilyticus]|uniref:Branched-chain amino acid ABC transporter n=1 Tax=Paenibacillus mucilaginosus K02 TaxID=997761 RepID=I0BUX5_9BACL|nr:AzlD domain-containing protein [Paenibacillus mucilaginosus]AFH66172.1 branched-chain amino acid ABC transporter [Paenibacillus mucilaginosus K02]